MDVHTGGWIVSNRRLPHRLMHCHDKVGFYDYLHILPTPWDGTMDTVQVLCMGIFWVWLELWFGRVVIYVGNESKEVWDWGSRSGHTGDNNECYSMLEILISTTHKDQNSPWWCTGHTIYEIWGYVWQWGKEIKGSASIVYLVMTK